MNSLDIRILGIVEYTDALEMMSELQRQRIEEEIPDTLLFLEHPEIVRILELSEDPQYCELDTFAMVKILETLKSI